jgi:hypothetical protein
MELIMLISHLFNVDLYILKLNFFSCLSISHSLQSVLGSVMVGGRPTFHHLLAGAQLLIILVPQLDNTALAVKLLSDLLVGLNELIDLSRQLVILVANNPDVVVHGVDLNLQVGVRFDQRRI